MTGPPAHRRTADRKIDDGRRIRAAFIERLGPPESIRYGVLPAPVPGPADVLVDVLASTVNPVDTFVRSGAFRTPLNFPAVISRDLVGTVAAAPTASGFAAGDQVWGNSAGHGGRPGPAAEQVVVAPDRLYHVPPGVDPVQAVAVAHPAATAYLALFTHGRLRAGDTVLVGGAAGNVGSALVVLAVDAGARVLATAAPDDAGYCRGLGAEAVFDYRDHELTARIKEHSPQGVDVYVDTSGHNDLAGAVDLLAQRGRIVLLAGARSLPVLPAGPLYMKDCSIAGFVISHATAAELAAAARAINRLLLSGRLRPRATEILPLRAAARAHARMERGELHGKRLILGLGTLCGG